MSVFFPLLSNTPAQLMYKKVCVFLKSQSRLSIVNKSVCIALGDNGPSSSSDTGGGSNYSGGDWRVFLPQQDNVVLTSIDDGPQLMMIEQEEVGGLHHNSNHGAMIRERLSKGIPAN